MGYQSQKGFPLVRSLKPSLKTEPYQSSSTTQPMQATFMLRSIETTKKKTIHKINTGETKNKTFSRYFTEVFLLNKTEKIYWEE